MIIVSKYLIPKGYAGMAFFPFILLSDKRLKNNPAFINHEKIHLRQQAELLVLPFYIWYTAEYIFRLVKYKDHGKAYRNISFEREAYHNQDNLSYLQQRKLWNFTKFIYSNN